MNEGAVDAQQNPRLSVDSRYAKQRSQLIGLEHLWRAALTMASEHILGWLDELGSESRGTDQLLFVAPFEYHADLSNLARSAYGAKAGCDHAPEMSEVGRTNGLCDAIASKCVNDPATRTLVILPRSQAQFTTVDSILLCCQKMVAQFG